MRVGWWMHRYAGLFPATSRTLEWWDLWLLEKCLSKMQSMNLNFVCLFVFRNNNNWLTLTIKNPLSLKWLLIESRCTSGGIEYFLVKLRFNVCPSLVSSSRSPLIVSKSSVSRICTDSLFLNYEIETVVCVCVCVTLISSGLKCLTSSWIVNPWSVLTISPAPATGPGLPGRVRADESGRSTIVEGGGS